MKKAIPLIAVFLLFIFLSTSLAYDAIAAHKGDKITPITGIILIAGENTVHYSHYDETVFGKYINNSPLMFITRTRLKEILNEHSLVVSGLVSPQDYGKIGQLAAASHLLEYECYFVPGERYNDDYMVCKLKLINISTSEIEYAADVMSSAAVGKFFKVLNKHAAKTH